MTDFVGRVLRPERDDWVIRSLLDIDFYKFTMGLFIYRYFRGIEVTFAFINRHLHIPLARIVDEAELRRQFDHVRTLMLERTDVSFLRGMDVYGHNMFNEEYLAFLAKLRLTPYTLTRVGDQYRLTFTGPWEVVTFWETIALSIITELFYRKLMQSMTEAELRVLFARATDKLYRKLIRIKSRPWIRFADFATRRRFSFLWLQSAIKMAREVIGGQLTGTSNTWMAFNQQLVPIGTNAHELPMVVTALANDSNKRDAQYEILRLWHDLFPMGGLRIVLPDTYGTKQFLTHMPNDLAEQVAHSWRGFRQDSGDPIAEAELILDWFARFGVDPMERGKIVIPSDGLDVDQMFTIDDALQGRIAHPFGWGTLFGNDYIGCHPRPDDEAVIDGERLRLSNSDLFRGHSFVCKVVSANGNAAVKLSNNTNKATGPKGEIERYLRIFGDSGRTTQEVVV